MKTVLRLISTIHGLMAILFACAALALIVIAARVAWVALLSELDRSAAQGVIEAVGLLAAAGGGCSHSPASFEYGFQRASRAVLERWPLDRVHLQ